jgi:NADP-dependent 3-hydroxy acid dehydrogenase YdfG
MRSATRVNRTWAVVGSVIRELGHYRNRPPAGPPAYCCSASQESGAMSDDPVLLITGASSGIGAATARHAAEAGYRVVLGARRESELRKLAGELGGDERAVARRCDVSDWADVEGLAEAAMERFGHLDAVFANAGVGAKRGFLEESVEHWKAMVDTNVLGVALTIRATLPHLLDADRGHYLITGSVAGKRVLPGSLYSATKWAVGAIAEALRQELRQMHENASIRVTLIEPGMVDTPFFEQRPQSGALQADDVARAVMYALAQPDHVDVNEVLVRPAAQAS